MFRIMINVMRYSHSEFEPDGSARPVYERDEVEVFEAHTRPEAEHIVRCYEMALRTTLSTTAAARRYITHSIEEVV